MEDKALVLVITCMDVTGVTWSHQEKKKAGLKRSQHLRDEDEKKRNLQRKGLCRITRPEEEDISSGSNWPLVSHITKKSRKMKTITCPLTLATRNLCALSESNFREVKKTDCSELKKNEQEASGD